METPPARGNLLLGKDRAEVERLTEMHMARSSRVRVDNSVVYEPHGE
jgi:hypothetical protein